MFGTQYDNNDNDESLFEIDTAAFIIITRPYTADFKDALQYTKNCLRSVLPHIDKQKQVYIVIATGNTKLTFSYVIYKVLQETRQLKRLNASLSQLDEVIEYTTYCSDEDFMLRCTQSSVATVSSDSEGSRDTVVQNIPVTKYDLSKSQDEQEIYRLTADELYKYRLHTQLLQYEQELLYIDKDTQLSNKQQICLRKSFIPPVYMKITGYTRVKVATLFNVVGIIPIQQYVANQHTDTNNIKVGNKIILLESKIITYPAIDAILLTIQRQLQLQCENIETTEQIENTEIDIPAFI